MERSYSQDIREECEELREAAEQTLNVILDVNLDGTIRWVSPSWTDVIGTPTDTVQGTAIADLIVSENKNVFSEVVEVMKSDDSRSQRIRFAASLGPLSKLLSLERLQNPDAQSDRLETIELEAQGIMVYDVVSGDASHVGRYPKRPLLRSLSVSTILIKISTDDVDGPTLDRSTRNPDRLAPRHCRCSRFGRRGPCQLPHSARRVWHRRPREPPAPATCPLSYLRTSNITLVV